MPSLSLPVHTMSVDQKRSHGRIESNGMIPLYDRGDHLAGVISPERACRLAELPEAEVVRSRAGEIKRIRLHAPGVNPDLRGFPRRATLATDPGQRYVYREQIWPDSPLRTYSLRESHFLPAEMLLETVVSVGAEVISAHGPTTPRKAPRSEQG